MDLVIASIIPNFGPLVNCALFREFEREEDLLGLHTKHGCLWLINSSFILLYPLRHANKLLTQRADIPSKRA